MWKLQCKGSLESLFYTAISFCYKITSPALLCRFETSMDTVHYSCASRHYWENREILFIIEWPWVGISLKHHLVPTLLPQAGTPSMKPGCSKTHPIQPWKHSQGRAPRTSLGNPFLCITVLIEKHFFFTSNVNLFQFKVIIPCPKTKFTISCLVALFLLINFTETSNLVYHLY